MTTKLAGILVSALAIGAAATGCALAEEEDERSEDTVAESPLGATTKSQLQYIVQAHPDDEIASWSMIERSPGNYPVFILLTQGEETSYCLPSGRSANQTSLGEAEPPGNPYQGKWTSGCRRARVDSWHRFLDAMADFDDTLSKPRYQGRFEADGLAGGKPPSHSDDGKVIESRSFRVYADESSARVVFDLGDGDLTPAEVTWAIQSVRAKRRQLFPRLKEYGVLAASYRNVDPRCLVYDHPDHRAVHVAIYDTDQGTRGPQWGRTCIHDPDVAAGGRIKEMAADVFEYALGVDARSIDPARYPNAVRTGVFQIHYGWLIDDYWAAHGNGAETFGDRKQAFWARY